jgi:hypothetical protein
MKRLMLLSVVSVVFLPTFAHTAYVFIPVVAVEAKSHGELTVAQSTAAPTIVAINPASGPIGTLITISGTGFTTKNDIKFKNDYASPFLAESPVSSDTGASLQLHVNPCPSYEPRCPTFFVPPGIYHVTVVNDGGESNEATFVLTSR